MIAFELETNMFFFLQIINFTQKRNLVLGLFYHNILPFSVHEILAAGGLSLSRYAYRVSPELPTEVRSAMAVVVMLCQISFIFIPTWGNDFRWVETTIVGIDLSLRDPFFLIIYFTVLIDLIDPGFGSTCVFWLLLMILICFWSYWDS